MDSTTFRACPRCVEAAVEDDDLGGIEGGAERGGIHPADRATPGHNGADARRPSGPRLEMRCATGGCRSRWSRPSSSGYGRIRHNLAESSVADAALAATSAADLGGLVLQYGDHLGLPALRERVAADGAGLERRRRPRHAGRGRRAVHHPHDAARGRLARDRRAAQLRDQPRDAADDRRRRRVPRPRVRGRLGGRSGRIAAMLRPGTRLVSLTTPHNPTGATLIARDARRGHRARRAPRRRAAARRRDVPRDDVRRAAAGRGVAVATG